MGSWAHGLMGPWAHGFMSPWAHGLMGPQAHGPMGPWVHGPMGSWAHGLMGPWTPITIHSPACPCCGCEDSTSESRSKTLQYVFEIQSRGPLAHLSRPMGLIIIIICGCHNFTFIDIDSGRYDERGGGCEGVCRTPCKLKLDLELFNRFAHSRYAKYTPARREIHQIGRASCRERV